MISKQLRATYYAAMAYPMRLNGVVYRAFRAPTSGTIKVHLGPGQQNYLKGWINVDANFITAKCDVWADLRNKLPFRDNTVSAFYSHHVIEHLPDSLLMYHFQEMYRCLKVGGTFRVGGPNGDYAIRKFVEGDKSWFIDFPDSRESIGGRFVNFVFCRGEHLTLLTASYLQEIAGAAGFADLHVCKPAAETRFPALIDEQVLMKESESTPDAPHTLIVEAQKAA